MKDEINFGMQVENGTQPLEGLSLFRELAKMGKRLDRHSKIDWANPVALAMLNQIETAILPSRTFKRANSSPISRCKNGV